MNDCLVGWMYDWFAKWMDILWEILFIKLEIMISLDLKLSTI